MCYVCHTNKGPCVQCSAQRCRTLFHPMCARVVGQYLQAEPNWDMHHARQVIVGPDIALVGRNLSVLFVQNNEDPAPTLVHYCHIHTQTMAEAVSNAMSRKRWVKFLSLRVEGVGLTPCWDTLQRLTTVLPANPFQSCGVDRTPGCRSLVQWPSAGGGSNVSAGL